MLWISLRWSHVNQVSSGRYLLFIGPSVLCDLGGGGWTSALISVLYMLFCQDGSVCPVLGWTSIELLQVPGLSMGNLLYNRRRLQAERPKRHHGTFPLLGKTVLQWSYTFRGHFPTPIFFWGGALNLREDVICLTDGVIFTAWNSATSPRASPSGPASRKPFETKIATVGCLRSELSNSARVLMVAYGKERVKKQL
jgi:hypothetical protein